MISDCQYFWSKDRFPSTVNDTFLRSLLIFDQSCGEFLKQAITARCFSAIVFRPSQSSGAWIFQSTERDQDSAGNQALVTSESGILSVSAFMQLPMRRSLIAYDASTMARNVPVQRRRYAAR
jgi:hypothetical protein